MLQPWKWPFEVIVAYWVAIVLSKNISAFVSQRHWAAFQQFAVFVPMTWWFQCSCFSTVLEWLFFFKSLITRKAQIKKVGLTILKRKCSKQDASAEFFSFAHPVQIFLIKKRGFEFLLQKRLNFFTRKE